MMIVRGGKTSAGDRLDRLIDLALAEAQEQNPGGESVRLRLSELVFVEAIRRHLTTMPHGETGWLAASGTRRSGARSPRCTPSRRRPGR